MCDSAALPSARDTPSPIDPESIQVPLAYEPDPQDLALSSVPGQEMFDPRKRKFSAEELKPQPMIKKARKVFIPEDLKVSLWGGGVRGYRPIRPIRAWGGRSPPRSHLARMKEDVGLKTYDLK